MLVLRLLRLSLLLPLCTRPTQSSLQTIPTLPSLQRHIAIETPHSCYCWRDSVASFAAYTPVAAIAAEIPIAIIVAITADTSNAVIAAETIADSHRRYRCRDSHRCRESHCSRVERRGFSPYIWSGNGPQLVHHCRFCKNDICVVILVERRTIWCELKRDILIYSRGNIF